MHIADRFQIRPRVSNRKSMQDTRFSGLSLAKIQAIHPRGIQNTFTLHFPDRSLFQQDIQTALPYLEKAKQIVEGDLHANPRKLLELLFLSNLVKGISARNARKLLSLAITAENTVIRTSHDVAMINQTFAHFKSALQGLSWADPNRSIMLIGDVISDRGPDDRFTLAIINQLNKSRPGAILNLAGNHDINVIDKNILPHQAKSMFPGLWTDKAGMEKLYRHYLSNSLLFHYSPGQNAFFSHAPLTADKVDELFHELNVQKRLPATIQSSAQITVNNIASFVDIVNRFFLDTIDAYYTNPYDVQANRSLALIHKLVWVRSDHTDKDDFPFRHIPRLKLIHGHDSGTKYQAPYSREVKAQDPGAMTMSHTIVNLDNQYLKSPTSQTEDRPLFLVMS